MRQHVFFKTISLLLALALSAGLLAVPAAASGCEHLVTGTRSEQLSCTEMGATVTTCLFLRFFPKVLAQRAQMEGETV